MSAACSGAVLSGTCNARSSGWRGADGAIGAMVFAAQPATVRATIATRSARRDKPLTTTRSCLPRGWGRPHTIEESPRHLSVDQRAIAHHHLAMDVAVAVKPRQPLAIGVLR